MHTFSRGVTAATLTLLALTLSGSAPEAGRPKPTEAAAGPSAPPGAAAIRAQIAKLPLAFEPNVGQASADVRYVSLGPSPRLELTDTEVRLTGPGARRGSKVVSLRLAGGARPSRVESQDELPGKVHHFDSNDPQQWRRDIPTFRRVAYRDVYPATDLVFHGSQDAVEFDFVLRPGASPGAIGIDVRGADAVTLDGGDVVIRTGGDTLRMHAPVVYQDSATGRKLVEGRFSIQDSRIGFEIGAYDPARPLVIDPVVTYSTYLGGTDRENSVGVGVDAAGNIYAAIERQDDGFRFLQGRFVKLSADGQTLLYSVTLGDMRPFGLVADATGNAYVVSTCPYDFDDVHFVCPTLKSLTSGAGFPGDAGTYVTKLGPTGSILFSTSIGRFGSVLPGGIAVDDAGNMYVTTYYFPLDSSRTTFGTAVEAIAADYSRFLYRFQFQTTDFQPSAPAVDRAGAVYVTGEVFNGFPTTPGVVQPTNESGTFTVVAKVAPDASLAYATYFGHASTIPSMTIAVDASGNAYLTGHAGPGFPTVNALQPTMAGGGSDAFVARLNATASALVFSTYLGGSGDDGAGAIALDGSGNIYLAGGTSSVDFPQQNALPPQFGQVPSSFVVKMTPDGRSLVYSTYFGDAQTGVTALHATASGTVYLAGTTSSTAFPTVRPYQAAYGGGPSDAFIATLVPSEPRVFVTSPAAGATVSDTVWTDVWVENVVGTSNAFTLTVGGTVVAEGTASNHATLAWDSSSIPDGAITLTATVRDAAGHVGVTTRDLIVRSAFDVFITSPTAGATVGGVVWSDIWVEGAAAGTRTFTLSIGGTALATASASGNHVTLPWDSSRVANGPQTIVATVRDAAGHGAIATRGLIVDNGPPLGVFITSPPAGATVGGVVWSDIWVEGAAAGTRTFTLSIGGTTLATASADGNHVTLPWDSSRVANGSQAIVVTVRDAAFHTGVATRTVNVQNGVLAGAGPAPPLAIAPPR